MAKSDPIFSRESRSYLNKVSSAFKENLEGISKKLTSHDKASRVDHKHIDQAFDSLALSGLRSRHWLERPETEAAAGSFLVGASLACPDVISTFFGGSVGKNLAQFVVIFLFCAGVVLFTHGTYRSRLPSPLGESGTVWAKVRIALMSVLVVALFGLTAAYMFVRTTSICPHCGEGQVPEEAEPIINVDPNDQGISVYDE